ncbi:MAG: hypothetical protein LBF78_14650 [Treponema sp.]|jgi:hypothetical protein|nr:hypothetical protein [Treponema sp.]
MKNRKHIFVCLFFAMAVGIPLLNAQTHISVPLDNPVYYVLEQAELRGLCKPLPQVKPYSRSRVLAAISETLSAEGGRFGALSPAERQILERARKDLTAGDAGLDLLNGQWRFGKKGGDGALFSGDVGIGVESYNSAGMQDGETYWGTDTWGTLYTNGDIGSHFSYWASFSAGLIKSPRELLASDYATYYKDFNDYRNSNFFDLSDPSNPQSDLIPKSDDHNMNRLVDTYTQPLAYFPYAYQKRWDGFLLGNGGSADNFQGWPEGFVIAPRLWSELAASAFNDTLSIRFSRIQHEWGGMTAGGSLALNAQARPFIAIETSFNPVYWFSFSAMTGVLEYFRYESIKDSAWTFQNAFSIEQIDFNFKNYFHWDIGTSAVWPKRFELGYIMPVYNNFLYQNEVGDFDNLAVFTNLKGQYPGLGSVWLSFFADEIEISSIKEMFELDRHMFAFQGGLKAPIPFIPFTSLVVSYTKVEPYTYTHTRNFVPWISGGEPSEVAYVNNGETLGYYLPPNSDEIKVRVESIPLIGLKAHLQYQMIRHGADFGPHQVDGSSIFSELEPGYRDSNTVLRKDFLKDGAYEWMHIIKAGASFRLAKLPITVFAEGGVVFSHFTDVNDADYAKYMPAWVNANADGTPSSSGYEGYADSTRFIASLGLKIFL